MNVLLALDGGDLSMRALDRTVERALAAGDTVTVAVYEGPQSADLDAVAAEARERAAEAGLDVDVHRIDADPGSRLVEMAEDGFDRLVMGGGTISPMGKIRIGDVIEFVLINAQTTVTLVR